MVEYRSLLLPLCRLGERERDLECVVYGGGLRLSRRKGGVTTETDIYLMGLWKGMYGPSMDLSLYTLQSRKYLLQSFRPSRDLICSFLVGRPRPRRCSIETLDSVQ